MTLLNRLKKVYKNLLPTGKSEISLLRQQNAFLLAQVAQLNQKLRYLELGQENINEQLETRSSFDYQWKELTTGTHLPSDTVFLQQVTQKICEMTQLPPAWFKEKKVIDVGCGLGRFTYGLLQLGAFVTACDQSEWALERTKQLCSHHQNHLTTMRINLLEDQLPQGYDLAFSFGVVHHTGRTYQAMKNVCQAVKQGGKVFFMIYGYPEYPADFDELVSYDRLRMSLHRLPFDKKKTALEKMFSSQDVHGWFDAISPEINDLLTYPEAVAFLTTLGIENIQRTVVNRNLHLIGDCNRP